MHKNQNLDKCLLSAVIQLLLDAEKYGSTSVCVYVSDSLPQLIHLGHSCCLWIIPTQLDRTLSGSQKINHTHRLYLVKSGQISVNISGPSLLLLLCILLENDQMNTMNDGCIPAIASFSTYRRLTVKLFSSNFSVILRLYWMKIDVAWKT